MKVSEETKKKISESLKRAFSENRAHGWANTKQNKNGMSYPEIWFQDMLKNNNLDLNYEYNMQFFKYKLDFAWPDKRICIEIDGSQHYTIKERAESDKCKDELLKQFGWKVLRLKWGYIRANTKESIELIKKFLTNSGDITIPLYKTKNEISNEIREKCILDNVAIDINGHYNRRKVTKNELEKRKQLILNSGIDLTKYGWVNKVSKITGLTKRMIYFVINNDKDLNNRVYKSRQFDPDMGL